MFLGRFRHGKTKTDLHCKRDWLESQKILIITINTVNKGPNMQADLCLCCLHLLKKCSYTVNQLIFAAINFHFFCLYVHFRSDLFSRTAELY